MKKAIFGLAAAAVIAAGTLTTPTPADARCRVGCVLGIGAAAVVGSAIVGSAIANSQPRYYAPAPGYVVYDGYAEPYPIACPGGFWARKPLYNRWGNVVGYTRPRFICP
jgi:hypothetical protein